MSLQLVLGNKNYSSWSMRAWLLLRLSELPFVEIPIALYRPTARDQVIARGGETGLVPVLVVDGYPIWDTLAITEYLFEQCKAIWPQDRRARARARSYVGEVHSGLNDLRAAMPVNARARNRVAIRTAAVDAEIARVAAIWDTAGADPASPWLFDRFCAADIMFAPVAARFQTYDLAIPGRAARYQAQLLAHPLVQEWFDLGRDEAETIPQFELPQADPHVT